MQCKSEVKRPGLAFSAYLSWAAWCVCCYWSSSYFNCCLLLRTVDVLAAFLYVVGHLCDWFRGSRRLLKDTPGNRSSDWVRRMQTIAGQRGRGEGPWLHSVVLSRVHKPIGCWGAAINRGEIDRIQVSVFDIKILSHSVKSKWCGRREIATCGQMSLQEMVLPCLLEFQPPWESLGGLCQMTVKKREKESHCSASRTQIDQTARQWWLLTPHHPIGIGRWLLCIAGKWHSLSEWICPNAHVSRVFSQRCGHGNACVHSREYSIALGLNTRRSWL